MNNKNKPSIFNRIWRMMLAVGPGIFCIGYTIGTGSVTAMARAGSEFGSQLLWVLTLSVIFSGVMMEAYGRYAIVTGETAMHSIKNKFRYGNILALAIIIGVVFAQWTCLSGIMGLSANAIYELFNIFYPGLSSISYWVVLSIAILITIILYRIILVGKYSFFEKVLVVFVTIMGICFIISMFIVLPAPSEIVKGFIPGIPSVAGGKLMVAAFVGTTMAAPMFVVRPLLMKGKGWGKDNTKEQSRDAFISACLMFIISGSVMITAMGALYYDEKVIHKVFDMVHTLEPIAGKFAVFIFILGIVSAGLSSVFPILMVAPLLIADYRKGELDTKSRQFKIITAIAAIIGLTVPIIDANPIIAQITTQVSGVFVLPLVIGAIGFLINSKKSMGKHKAGLILNLGIVIAFVFACFMVYTGIIALNNLF